MTERQTPVGGIYEACVGVREPLSQIQYWQQFGYRIGEVGELPAETAKLLYGVNSSLRSIRLYHLQNSRGLIRLMIWEKPLNDGLGTGSMKVKGNRWITTLTADILNILNHAEIAKLADLPVRFTAPEWDIIYNQDRKIRPFVDPAIGVREMMLLQPLTRQIFFQRFNYTLPYYGNIDESAFFKTSEITHFGIVIQDDSKEKLLFYEQVLGLLRTRDDVETTYEASQNARNIFELQPKEKFLVTTFDEPRSSKTDLQAVRSGRLFIVRFPENIQLQSRFEEAKPGCLGMSLYTYPVRNIEEYFTRLQASQAQNITEIFRNEFGERSFSFIAPDGYFWNLIENTTFFEES